MVALQSSLIGVEDAVDVGSLGELGLLGGLNPLMLAVLLFVVAGDYGKEVEVHSGLVVANSNRGPSIGKFGLQLVLDGAAESKARVLCAPTQYQC